LYYFRTDVLSAPITLQYQTNIGRKKTPLNENVTKFTNSDNDHPVSAAFTLSTNSPFISTFDPKITGSEEINSKKKIF